jgi:hypothetical protein
MTPQPYTGSPGNCRTALKEGIRLSPEDVAFIASAWGVDVQLELIDLLTRPEDWDAESLIVMLFSADARAGQRFLDAIQAARFTEADADRIIEMLQASPPAVPIRMPDDLVLFTLPAPPLGLERYVETLKINRRLPAPAAMDFASALPAARRSEVLSQLRLSRLVWDDDNIALLTAFFSRLGKAEDLTALLSVLTGVLENASGRDHVEKALAERKRTYFRAMNAADRFTASNHRYNMETLMMMGIQPPVISSREARRQMNITDRISMVLFGSAETLVPESMTVSETRVDSEAAGTNVLAWEMSPDFPE